MQETILNSDQSRIASNLNTHSLFLEGPPGCGKTTTGVAHLSYLIENGIPLDTILILVPQRSLASPYSKALTDPRLPPGGFPSILTLGGLAQRLIKLFWPAIASSAGFQQPNQPPRFLTLETAQYFMSKITAPLLQEGYFEQVVIDRNRLFSQIIDNLNKAAVIGISHNEISERLKSAWAGKTSQTTVYDQAQECANRFRKHCLQNNLLDYSLQIEVFSRHLANSHLVSSYLNNSYRHLIYDNIEEDVPISHDFIRDWLPNFETALLIYDVGSGYRAFLGADPLYGLSLKNDCSQVEVLSQSFIMPTEQQILKETMEKALSHRLEAPPTENVRKAFGHVHKRFHTEMIDWVAAHISEQINEDGVLPRDITVLSPYLSDTLRFNLMQRMELLGVPVRSHRPSRSLRDEPAAKCLLTIAKLAHPDWEFPVSAVSFRSMLLQVLDGIDLNRADLITKILYQPKKIPEVFGDFDKVVNDQQDRISYSVGERYTHLRDWMIQYREGTALELDVFLSRLFGEVLSQPGFGFHKNWDAAAIAGRMVESVQKFRPVIADPEVVTGKEYIQMVDAGVISALYLENYSVEPENAVMVTPAHSFLMSNRSVRFQYWLDIGTTSWGERLFQPLTHPYVLSRRWTPGRVWSDADEYGSNQESLIRLISGLIQRCSGKIILCASRVNEFGLEERGPLLQALQTILRRMPPREPVDGF